MRITWVTRSFLDYRIPVFKALDEMCGHQLTVIYYKDIPPVRCQEKLRAVLGDRAIARERELRIGNRPKVDNASRANSSIRIPLSPGLIKQVIDTKPDVLVSDGFMQWTYATLAVRALKRIPHVMLYERTAHTERTASVARKLYRKIVSHWIDAIGCNGKLTGEYVKQLLGWDDSRLSFGHMVADVVGLKEKVNRVSDEEIKLLLNSLKIKGTLLLFVGQLIPRKGVKELLEAWIAFKKRFSYDCTLMYIGTGTQENELKSLATSSGVKDFIMLGAIDYEQIAKYYKAADCFIIPTLEDNWSLVVPEAMACELPVATSIYNGCHPELVHPENGWTFDPLSQESIINVLHDIVENRSHLKEMGAKSMQIVSKETANRAADSIMKAINIALKRVYKR